MTRVKICGITTEDDIGLCVSAGVSALGFVVEYPEDVPWNLDRQTARELVGKVPPFVSRVIVVGGDPAVVLPTTELLRPHAVQLHGSEPLERTSEIVRAAHALGALVIKALRFSTETGQCLGSSEAPLEVARRIRATGVDALLLDSVSNGRPAGTGKSIDWGTARTIRDGLDLPVILAGGLHADNVRQAIDAVAPYAVDVISGVEGPRGRKDPAKVRSFVDAVRR